MIHYFHLKDARIQVMSCSLNHVLSSLRVLMSSSQITLDGSIHITIISHDLPLFNIQHHPFATKSHLQGNSITFKQTCLSPRIKIKANSHHHILFNPPSQLSLQDSSEEIGPKFPSLRKPHNSLKREINTSISDQATSKSSTEFKKSGESANLFRLSAAGNGSVGETGYLFLVLCADLILFSFFMCMSHSGLINGLQIVSLFGGTSVPHLLINQFIYSFIYLWQGRTGSQSADRRSKIEDLGLVLVSITADNKQIPTPSKSHFSWRRFVIVERLVSLFNVQSIFSLLIINFNIKISV